MNSDQLESLLREADESAGRPAEPSANLANRVRSIYAHRRRRDNGAKFVIALAGCYAAGIATAWIVLTVAAVRDDGLAQRRLQQGPPRSTSVHRPSDPPDEQEDTHRDTDPDLSSQPSVAGERSRYDLLRRLGDENHQRGDLQTAISYYGQALDAATDVERRVSYQQDNWLLISLKRDRLASETGSSQEDSI